MAVGDATMFVPATAVFVRRVGVFLAPVMSSVFMMVGGLTVVMGRRLMMRCRVVVMFAGRMFRCSHYDFSFNFVRLLTSHLSYSFAPGFVPIDPGRSGENYGFALTSQDRQ
jgi:hypothetical protein